MYNIAQVVIDLEEYDELKKKVAAFEAGNDNKREEYLLKTVVSLMNQLATALIQPKIDTTNYGIRMDNSFDPPKFSLIEKII